MVSCAATPLSGGSGAATAAVVRLVARVRFADTETTISLVRKEFQPLLTGRHAAGAADPAHWAYWRREPLAYASGVLPSDGGLVAPVCYGVDADAVYLADVVGPPEQPSVAAERLAAWQAAARVPLVSWLAIDQLAQRVAVSDLDWPAVDADPRVAAVWARRGELLSLLDDVPRVPSHGDFHPANTVAAGERTVVLDWGAFGVAPVGADLAHLALATLDELVPAYLDGAAGRWDARSVRLGYAVTLALTGAGRVHWMLSLGVAVPTGYPELVLAAEALARRPG